MECFDVSADIHTDGVVLVGQSNESIFELCDVGSEEVDTDWHSVQLEYGRTYLFFLTANGTAPTVQPKLTFFNRSGIPEAEFDTFGQLHFRYTARYSGRHYVSAFQGSLLNQTTYAINAFEIKDDTKGTGPPIGLIDGYGKLDEIEVVGDTDTFNFEVFGGRMYKFIVVGADGGQTLSNPSLELLRDGSIIASGSSFIAFDAATRETLQVSVGGNGGTGTYQVIGLVADDAGQDATTTSELTFDSTGLAVKEGYISEVGDFDWHKVELSQGDIVRVTLKGSGIEFLATPSLIFRDTDLNVISGQGIKVPSADARLEYYYKAETTGTHYVVARTKIESYNGAYQVAVEKVRTPATPNNLFGRGDTSRLLFDEGSSIPLSSLLDLKGLDPFAFQVHSSVPLMRDGNIMSANKTYGIIAGNIGLWSVDESQVSDIGDLMMRAIVTGEWSEWQKFAVAPATIPANLISSSIWEGTGPITYRFVSSRPADYGANEFGDFVPVSEFSPFGESITDVFAEFNRVTNRMIVAAESGQEADINIFAVTDLGQPFLSYRPNPGRGGDMIFNEEDFLGEMNDLTQFRMLRSLGTALGLNFASLTQLDSVMGNTPHPKGLIPMDLGAADWLAFQEMYGSVLRDPTDEFAQFRNYVLNGDPISSTVSFEGRNIIVGDDVLNENFNIDLRDGARSFARDNGVVTSEVIVGFGTQAYSGVGGNGDDFIFGNGLENVLQGGNGSDFLTGNENDDIMIGGLGNDTMIHYFGDGNDFVSDEGGVDTLCFIGRGPFEVDNIFEDYLFTRNGQYLDVSLTLDGGPQDGSVRIDTGFNNNNLIESLELWHEGALRERISLFNLWNELSDGQTSRFQLLAGSDNFGRLVSPA